MLNRVDQEDCLSFMQKLKDHILVNVIVTSPTYNINKDNIVSYKVLLMPLVCTLATEGSTRDKFCESRLRNRSKLCQENAVVIVDYIIAMKREVNPRLNYIKYTIQFLSELVFTMWSASLAMLQSLLVVKPITILFMPPIL